MQIHLLKRLILNEIIIIAMMCGAEARWCGWRNAKFLFANDDGRYTRIWEPKNRRQLKPDNYRSWNQKSGYLARP